MRRQRTVVAISWNSSQGPTLGVEWEVQLIDAQTRLLRQDADQVLAGLTGLDASGEHRHIRHELMQSTVEIVTGICSTVSEARVEASPVSSPLQNGLDAVSARKCGRYEARALTIGIALLLSRSPTCTWTPKVWILRASHCICSTISA